MENGTAIESGGMELSFDQNVWVLQNTIETRNAPHNELGDGESIMTQNSGTPDVLDAGAVTQIAATNLTDTDALWGAVTESGIARYPEVVAILTGSGTGEWRVIKRVNTKTKTLTVNQPWDPVPEVGSLYSVFVWTLKNATIQGNLLMNNPNGIVLYDGCYNCDVENNTLINSRGIQLRTADLLLNKSLYPEGRRLHEVAIGDRVLNNIVSDTAGIRPAFIVLDTEAFAADFYRGMSMINIQVGGNIINPYAKNTGRFYDAPPTELPQDGFFPCFLFGPAPVKDPVTLVFQHINFWSNVQRAPVKYLPGFSPYTTQACVTASPPSG
jgi:parallel beta-helix repeat protein